MNTSANSTQKNNGSMHISAKANYLLALCLLLSSTAIAQSFETVSVNPFSLTSVSSYSSVAFGDLDNDGDLDMLSGNADGSFYYFVNTGSQTAPDFSTTAATNPFSLTDVGTNSRPFIIDLDGDGLLDVVAGTGGGDINFFKNGGTLETPSFETAVQNPYGLNGSGGNSSVSFADLDKDGDLDFIKVINNGDFKYQENIAASGVTIPDFTTAVTNPYNLNPSLGGGGGGGGGGGSGSLNSPAFVDLDGDEDFDILSGATNGQLYFFENIGTDELPDFTSVVENPFGTTDVGTNSAPAVADLDGDGDLDLMLGENGGGFHYFSQCANSFSYEYDVYFQIDSDPTPTLLVAGGTFSSSSPDLSINTSTGLIDVSASVVGSYTVTYTTSECGAVTKNITIAQKPTFAAVSTQPFSLTDDMTNLAFADLDEDGDQDLIVSNPSVLIYYENVGTPFAAEFTSGLADPFGLISDNNTGSIFVDLDGDSDLDLIVGQSSGSFEYFRNQTSSGIILFSSQNLFIPALPEGYSKPTFADLDNDGDFDLLAGSNGPDLLYIENTGDDQNPAFPSFSVLEGVSNLETGSHPFLVDLDLDNDYDIAVGNYKDAIVYIPNLGTPEIPKFDNTYPAIDFVVSNAWGSGTPPTFADLNGDCRLDLIFTSSSQVGYYENTLPGADFSFSSYVFSPIDADPMPITEIVGGTFSVSPVGLDINTSTGEIDVSESTIGEYTVTHTTDLCDVSKTLIIVDEALEFTAKSTNPFGLIDVGSVANPTFADLDNDGDQDLLVGEITGNFLFFENIGTAELPNYSSPQQNSFGIESVSSKDTPRPTLADMDGDDDFDIIVGFATGDYFYYENEGTVLIPDFKIPVNLSLSVEGAYATPFAADLDGDGDVDLLSGTDNGDFLFYENTAGENNPPAFSAAVTNPFLLSNIGFPAANIIVSSSLGDLDNDGDLDIMSGQNYPTGSFQFFQNIGTNLSPSFFKYDLNPFALSNASVGMATSMVDLDNDGDLDLFAGTDNGDFFYYRNKLIDNLTSYVAISQELTCEGGADGVLTASPTGGDGNYTYAWDNGITETTATVSGLAAGTYTVTVTDGLSAISTATITLGDGPLEDADFTYDAAVYITTGSNPTPTVATAGGTFFSVPTGLIFEDSGTGEIFLSGSIPGTYTITYTTATCGDQISKSIEITNTLTWDGDEGTAWATANNWDFNVAPVSSNVVVIPDVTFDPTIFVTDEAVGDLEIQSGGSLTIAGGSLTINGNLQLGGDLSVASDAALLPMGSISGDGNATINRSTTFGTEAGKYSVIGSPITFGSTSSLGNIVYEYDETIPFNGVGNDRFISVITPEFMSAGDAYFSANTGSISFVGKPNSGNIDVGLNYTDGRAGRVEAELLNDYALVSNPYTAAISYNNLMTGNTDIDGTLYFWDDGGSDVSQRDNSDYITATSMGAAGGGSTRSADWDGYIRSTQGFFVAFNSSGTFHLTPTMMVTSNNDDDGYFRKAEGEIMRFALSSDDFYSDILIGFAEEATVDFDRTLDAHKLKGNGDLQLYSRMGEEIMAIQALPVSLEERTIDLGFDAAKAGTYSLSISDFSESELQVYLIDHSLNKKMNLTEVNTYTFTTSKVEDSHRFSLLFAPYEVLSVEQEELSNELTVYSKNQDVFLRTNKEVEEATVSIYTLNGTLIQQVSNISFKRSKWSTSFNGEGVFIVTLETDKEFLVSKFHK